MSLDNIVCPECNGEDIKIRKEHNPLNLAVGLPLGIPFGVALTIPTENIELIGLGPVLGLMIGMFYYFADVPCGPKREYCCTSCEYRWDFD